MKDMTNSMNRQSQTCSRGIVSTYFLAILLYITSFVSVLVLTDQNRLKTVMNMKEANQYLLCEIEVIEDLKCRLENQDLEDNTIVLETCTYTFEVFETQCYVSLYGEVEEEMILTIDPETHRILKYEAIR